MLDPILATRFGMDGAGVLTVRWRRWASSRGGAMGGARRRSLSHAMVHYLGWGFFLQGAVRFGELTWGVFSRRGAPEQGARQRGSSSDLRRWWWGASRCCSQRGRAKRVRRQLQITDVRLLELEKLLTRHGDVKGYLGLASVFHKILARGSSIYRGFGSMISCVRRTLSPSHLGFSFDWISLGFLVGEDCSVQRHRSA
jgi:hypothetical protein